MEPLKNMFNREVIEKISTEITKIYKNFAGELFVNDCLDDTWENLELKERMHHIAVTLRTYLPENYAESLEILKQVKPQFSGFESITLPDYVETYGLEYFDESIDALKVFTINSSSEFAVRPYIKKYGQKMMDVMFAWSNDNNEHVRRLSSEGCRPRLPWAMALAEFKKDPSSILPILENLKDDPSEYVRKSVANNLNDISKDHPGLVIQIAEKWLGVTPERDKLVKHALRTLLKKGNPKALALFGFGSDELIKVSEFGVDNQNPKIGEEFNFFMKIENSSPVPKKIRVEYRMDFVKKAGKRSGKIFQIFEKDFLPGEKISTNRKHSFLNRTTRTHYPGEHTITLIINGEEKLSVNFQLD